MSKEKRRTTAMVQKRKRDLISPIDANNVNSWGIEKQHVKKMDLEKERKKGKKIHKDEDQLSIEVIEQEVFSTVVGTPKRDTITLPPSLHDSPVPVTRRRLVMAMAEGGATEAGTSPLLVTTTKSPATTSFDVPSSSNASKKKLTPRRRKQ